MGYYRRGSGRGKAGISREIGAAIFNAVRVHDDGVYNYGGTQSCVSGPYGSGKTTFLLQLAQSVGHLREGLSKEQFHPSTTTLMPETIVWRGRKFDYWNSLLASNWRHSFPQTPITRPVCVHVHADDDERLAFYEFTNDKEDVVFDGRELSYLTYKNAVDLCGHFLKGGVNVVYEPVKYFLREDVVVHLIKRTLEDLRLVRLKRKKKGKEDLPMDTSGIQAPSEVFWFELLEVVQETKAREDYFSFFIDEASQVIPENPRGEMYHLNKWFADSMLDFRRNNISLYLGAQDIKDLDWRITDKIKYYFWLPGAHLPDRRFTQLDQPITALIDKGEVIPEESYRRFGFFTFTAIPDQPPIIYVDGLRDDAYSVQERQKLTGEVFEAPAEA